MSNAEPTYPLVWWCCGREFGNRTKKCSKCGRFREVPLSRLPPTEHWFKDAMQYVDGWRVE